MLQQPHSIPQPQFPIRELEQIEAAIGTAQNWLATLQTRMEVLTAELDRITRPLVTAATSLPKTIGPGVEYRGTMYQQWNYIDIHIALLTRLWMDFPDQREAMARAVGLCGNTRTYVATNRSELFPAQTDSFAQRFSRNLVDGWYVDTNLGRERMCRILPAAVRAAGLRWGEDVRVYWRATKLL